MQPEQLIANFANHRPVYEALASRTADLLSALINRAEIAIHIIEHRAKTVDSLSEKIKRPNKSYNSLDQIPDLSGVRVICYYNDDCAKICDLISEEFKVVEEENSHSTNELEEDRFGYLSLHRVVMPACTRADLPEWNDVSDLKCEIQIRTVIQHAWAAVSHQVQYKLETATPSNLKRKLNRLAGLFELADEQFVEIRNTREVVAQKAIALTERDDLNFELSPSSIRIIIDKWKNDNNTIEKINSLGFSATTEVDPEYDGDDDIVSTILEISELNNIKTATDLLNTVGKFNYEYMKKQREASNSDWAITSTFAMLLHLIYKVENKPSFADLVDKGWGKDIARRVLEIAQTE